MLNLEKKNKKTDQIVEECKNWHLCQNYSECCETEHRGIFRLTIQKFDIRFRENQMTDQLCTKAVKNNSFIVKIYFLEFSVPLKSCVTINYR